MPSVDGLILTASGGPFRQASAEDMAASDPGPGASAPDLVDGREDHDRLGDLANKGLEVIEAHWLYDVGYDVIEVVIHPQSVVHSAVRFVDGSLKAQLAPPICDFPIQYALIYPDRLPSPAAAADLIAIGRLDFEPPDEERFPALRIAREAAAPDREPRRH